MAGSGGVASGAPRALTRVLFGGPWQLGQQTTGIAVDDQGRVFINDENNVYVVTGATPSVFLSRTDVIGLSDTSFGILGFQDLDIGPDQQLYVAIGRTILRTNTAHTAALWRDLSASYSLPFYESLAVVGIDRVALATSSGLFDVTPAAAKLVYDPKTLNWGDSCATEDLSAARSGVFLYQPGCNGSPLVRGDVDGSGVGVLYKSEYAGGSPLKASNFVCSARDPKGGFYVVTRVPDGLAPELYHLTEDSDQVNGIELIDTTPTLAQAQSSQTETFGFDYCAIAGAPDGSVYLVTYSQLWRVAPE